MMGIGIASGETRALDAAQQATNSSLLEASISGATRVLFSIAGGPDLTLTEVVDNRIYPVERMGVKVISMGFYC